MVNKQDITQSLDVSLLLTEDTAAAPVNRRTLFFTKWSFEPDVLYLHHMATSRDHDESPRPSRIRRIPGHLEDYELSYPVSRSMQRPTIHADVSPGPFDSGYMRRHDMEETRWRRMEDCMMNIHHQMRGLHLAVAESRDLNTRVQRLEQLTPPVHQAAPNREVAAGSPANIPDPEISEIEQTQNVGSSLDQVQRTSAPPTLVADVSVSHPWPLITRTRDRPGSASNISTLHPDYLLRPVHPPNLVVPPQHNIVASPASPAAQAVTQPTLPQSPVPTPVPNQLAVPQPGTVLSPTTIRAASALGFQPWIPPVRPVPQYVPPQVIPPQYVPPQVIPPQSVPPQVIPPQYVPPQVIPPQSVQPQYVPPQVIPPQSISPTVHPPGPPSNHLSVPNLPCSDPNMIEMIIASSYGIPKPRLPVFSSGKESDFSLLKKGLDSILGPHKHLSEDYRYQILLDHLKFPSALQVAKRYIHDPTPYTSSLRALEQRYGQPRQLVQSEISAILHSPPIRLGDPQAFEDFSLSVASLVGMLTTMEGVAESELHCGSHVDRLLTKLPPSYRDSFAEFCLNRGIIRSGSNCTYTLFDLAEWLERKSQAIQVSRRATELYLPEKPSTERRSSRPTDTKPGSKSTSIYYGLNPATAKQPEEAKSASRFAVTSKKREKFKPYCPFCEATEHYLGGCNEFAKQDLNTVISWIRDNNKCWRCGRNHSAETCTLKKPCSTCSEQHLLALHDLAKAKEQNPSILTMSTASSVIYIDHPSHSGRVMLKVVRVQLHNGKRTMDTFAVLDDGSERTIILPAAVKFLGLAKTDEVLALRTIRQDVLKLHGGSVSFEVSTKAKPKLRHRILKAFTAEQLALAEQSCPAETLKKRFHHLKALPLKGFSKVKPMLLIGSDNPHLITPVSPVLRGPVRGPVAVCTELGWALQGPVNSLPQQSDENVCLHSSFITKSPELYKNVEKLWQLDVLPFKSEKEVTRSKEDQQAINMLEAKTSHVSVDGVERYATPLLRRKQFPRLQASPDAVMALLRSSERRLRKDPSRAQTHNQEIQKLTGSQKWRYVPSPENPADDMTRGKSLMTLAPTSRWAQGPMFLREPPESWPLQPTRSAETVDEELRKGTFCGHVTIVKPVIPDPSTFTSWEELIKATHQILHGAASSPMTAAECVEAEITILKTAQLDSFADEFETLAKRQAVRTSSRISALSPEYDPATGLIRVGGRLRRAEGLDSETLHPILLAPEHSVTRLIVQYYDTLLLHPGPERVFAEIRRYYWIIRGRQVIRKHQRQCVDCQKLRGRPIVPKMADLPTARLRIHKPPFWSTGVDCFGPFTIKIGRRHEKRWGIIFKCLTTRCVHLDLLPSLDSESFLMSLRRFISRRGTPFEIWSDQGTNFRGGARELHNAFSDMNPILKEQLAEHKITFHCNPPHAPHFGGAWEREIRSAKCALQVILKEQVVTEEVLLTALIEVEGILNAKPLGYASSDIADPDPITPNLLLMGRRDSSLPQVVYGTTDFIGSRRWKQSQIIADHFWSRFIRRYLPGLQPRQKWLNSGTDLNLGQVVMIVDSQLPRAMWPVGRITKVFPGADGRVRSAEVQLKDHKYTRPVAKLVTLPQVPDDQSTP